MLDALQLTLAGASLSEVLISITRLIESHSEDMLCSIFLVDPDGRHLHYAAAPP
jgi:formate hydrogenlyase transcriptional activator